MSLELIKKLRLDTGISLKKCQEALAASQNDLDKAREFLRKAGEADAAKKSDRSAQEGRIALKTKEGKGIIVQIFCETDFTARNAEFLKLTEEIAELAFVENNEAQIAKLIQAIIQKNGENVKLGEIKTLTAPQIASYLHSDGKTGVLIALSQGSVEVGKKIAMQVAAMNPRYLKPEDVPAAIIAKETEIQKSLLAKSGKPEQIWDKILQGKIRKFCNEQSLLQQNFVQDSTKTVAKYLAENQTVVTDFVRLKI